MVPKEIFYHNFQGVGLVVCGDDKGIIWLYNMPTMVQVGKHIAGNSPSRII